MCRHAGTRPWPAFGRLGPGLPIPLQGLHRPGLDPRRRSRAHHGAGGSRDRTARGPRDHRVHLLRRRADGAGRGPRRDHRGREAAAGPDADLLYRLPPGRTAGQPAWPRCRGSPRPDRRAHRRPVCRHQERRPRDARQRQPGDPPADGAARGQRRGTARRPAAHGDQAARPLGPAGGSAGSRRGASVRQPNGRRGSLTNTRGDMVR